jgi:hypothetical protein
MLIDDIHSLVMARMNLIANKIPGQTLCLRDSLRFGRQLCPLFRPHEEVCRPDQLEHGVVLDRLIAIFYEFVSVEQLGQEDLDFLQRKVETNTHTRASSEGNVGCLMAVLDFRGVPPVWVELGRVIP